MNHQQPSIEFLGLTIQEPMNVFTDLLISFVCFMAYYRLNKLNKQGKANTCFRNYFLILGFGTLISGFIGHGFLNYFSFKWKLLGWTTSMVAITLIERAFIYYSGSFVNKKILNFFLYANIVELVLFVVLTFVTLDFFYVRIQTTFGLLLYVFGLSLILYFRYNNLASQHIFKALGMSGLAAIVFVQNVGLGKWFNHLDVSHTLMAGAVWYFYQGAKNIDKPTDMDVS